MVHVTIITNKNIFKGRVNMCKINGVSKRLGNTIEELIGVYNTCNNEGIKNINIKGRELKFDGRALSTVNQEGFICKNPSGHIMQGEHLALRYDRNSSSVSINYNDYVFFATGELAKEIRKEITI